MNISSANQTRGFVGWQSIVRITNNLMVSHGQWSGKYTYQTMQVTKPSIPRLMVILLSILIILDSTEWYLLSKLLHTILCCYRLTRGKIRPRSHLSFGCQTKSEENQTFTLPTKCHGNFNTVGVGWQKVHKNPKRNFRRSEDSEYLLFSDKQNEGRRCKQKYSYIYQPSWRPKWANK